MNSMELYTTSASYDTSAKQTQAQIYPDQTAYQDAGSLIM